MRRKLDQITQRVDALGNKQRRIMTKQELDEALDKLTPADVAAMPQPLRGVVDATLTYRRIVNP